MKEVAVKDGQGGQEHGYGGARVEGGGDGGRGNEEDGHNKVSGDKMLLLLPTHLSASTDSLVYQHEGKKAKEGIHRRCQL